MDVRINTIQAMSPIKKYQSTSRTAETAPTVKQSADKVDFSESGKIISQALKQAMLTPEVREEKVAEIQAKIQNGTYNPDSKAIASKMVSSMLTR